MRLHNTCVLLVLLLVIIPATTKAAVDITFTDLDGDGDPDQAFFKDAARQLDITVFDEDDDMRVSQLKHCCDFDSDVWIFSRGKGEIIVDFDNANALTAYIYDDIDQDGEVSYLLSNTSITITEGMPRLTAVARGDSWFIDDKPNYNVDLYIDSEWTFWGIDAVFKLTGGIPDNNSDVNIMYFDNDLDGDPDLEYNNRALGAKYALIGDATDVQPIKGFIYWPLLGSVIKFDASKSKIIRVDHLIPTRLSEGNYFIYFIKDFKEGEVRYGWESPIAYYDLAEDKDFKPELVIRLLDDLGETTEDEAKGRRYYEKVHYGWDQDNNNDWDYNIFFAGRNEYNSIVEYPGINWSVKTVPFKDAPYWIFERNWSITTFAVDELLGEGLSEIFYVTEWFSGFNNKSVDPELKFIPHRVGNREERAVGAKGVIYLSPIDGKLHLLDAVEGTWLISTPVDYGYLIPEKFLVRGDISTTEKIEYRNLNNDGYIDQWIYYVNDTPEKYLMHTRDFLVYSDKRKVKLLKTRISPSLFETLPPRDHEEWLKLKELLERYKKKEPRDLEALFSKFSGSLINIKNGFIRDFKLTEDGFNLIFDCKLFCDIDSDIKLNYDFPLPAGEYFLEYDGKLTIREFIKDIQIHEEDIIISDEYPTELEFVTITATIHNPGMTDMGPILVQFFDGNPDIQGRIIANITIPLLRMGGKKEVVVEQALKVGPHEIFVKIDPADSIEESDEGNNVAVKNLYVSPIEQPSLAERLKTGVNENTLAFSLFMILIMLSLVFYLASILLRF